MRKLQKKSVVFTVLLVTVLMVVVACFMACGTIDVAGNGGGNNNNNNNNNNDTYCVVVFHENGGSSVDAQRVDIGGKVDRPVDPTRDGFEFGGWFKDRDFDNEWDFDTDTVSGTSLTLYAKWTQQGGDRPEPIPEDECIVTLYPNNGTVLAPVTVKVGEKVSDPNAYREGYTLDGWFTDDGKKWDFDTDTVSGDTLVLRARWTLIHVEPNRCTVVFVTNCSATAPQQTVDEGGKVSRPNITNAGYTLDGWFKDDGTEWNFATDTVSGETLVLTARWTLIQQEVTKCVVTFVTNCSATAQQQTIDIGGKVVQPNITNAGYTLDGWYNGGTKWNFATDTVSGATLTLTARWTVVGDGEDVTVTFNVGRDARLAGVYNPAAVTVPAGSTIAEPQLTRDGYSVSGWYAEEGSTKWNFSVNTVTENVTLFAKWQVGGGGGGGGGGGDTPTQYAPTMKESNTLYIHYLRSASDYDGWYIYNWKDGDNNQEIKNTVAIDDSGAVFAINLKDSINNGLSTINFIVTQAGWNKDGGDNTVTLSNAQKVEGSYHWYIKQGKTANGSSEPPTIGEVVGGNEPKRESQGNVNRNYAKNLPVMSTVSGWDEMGVGYQIFVASFCDSNGDGVGDLKGIISKLDYLQSLNVDVLWLTPIQSSNSYHGYDCYDYYSIDPKFGTNADYRRLVFEAHSRGMKIIMDLVVNHTSPNNEWFKKSKDGVIEEVTYQDGTKATVKYRDFYRWKSSGGNRMESAGDNWYFYSSFGGNMPELNYDYQPVRDAMVDVAAYWMSYGLDGFRMDAIKHVFMWDESDNAGGDREGGANDRPYNYNETKNVEFFKEFNYKLKSKYPHCYLLGEQLNGNTDDVSPFYKGMDSLFDFNTYYNLPGRLDGGAAATANEFNANAQKYQTNRADRPINCMISSNHDINRLNSIIGGNTAKAKLYMAVIMTMPGLSWIYYGDEIGLAGQKGGDDDLRQSMKWTSSWANKCTAIYDNGANNSTKSVADQQNDSNSMLSYVKSLTKFRNDNPTLINGTATCSESNGMLKIVVTGGGQTYTVYHNFSGSSKTVSGNVVFGSSTVPAYGTAIVQ
ncbi:MAG: InlB B-repeat-containing protein [Clostridiales bacterium]|nr:InlB B-repeat-containing protein [Clostridiales bacterium]